MKLRYIFCRHTYTVRTYTIFNIQNNGKHVYYQLAYILQCSKCGYIKNKTLDTEADISKLPKNEIEEIILLSV